MYILCLKFTLITYLGEHKGKVIKQKNPKLLLVKGLCFLSAGSRLHHSNRKTPNITGNKELTNCAVKLENSNRFTSDLVKIHEFYKIFQKEITLILQFPKK